MSTPSPSSPASGPGDGVHSLGFAVGVGIGSGCLLFMLVLCSVILCLKRKSSASLVKHDAEAASMSAHHQNKHAHHLPAYDEIGGAPPRYSAAGGRTEHRSASVPRPPQPQLCVATTIVAQPPRQGVEEGTSPASPVRSPARMHSFDLQGAPPVPLRSPLRNHSCELPRPAADPPLPSRNHCRAHSFDQPLTTWQCYVLEPFAFIL